MKFRDIIWADGIRPYSGDDIRSYSRLMVSQLRGLGKPHFNFHFYLNLGTGYIIGDLGTPFKADGIRPYDGDDIRLYGGDGIRPYGGDDIRTYCYDDTCTYEA